MMQIFDVVAPFVLSIFSTYFFVQLIICFVPLKKVVVLKIIAVFALYTVLRTMIFPEDIINISFAFIGFIITMLICFDGTLAQRISAVFILYPLIVGVNFLTEDIGLQIYIALGSSEVAEIILHFLTYLVRIPIYYCIYKYFKSRISTTKELLTGRLWIFIGVICLASLVGMITFIAFTPTNVWMIYPASISTIISSVGIISLTGYIAETTKSDMENKNLRLQEAYYKELEENQREVSKLRHDINNHLSVIGFLMQSRNSIEAQAYFDDLSDEFSTNNRIFCENSIVNAVLNAKYNLAKHSGIDCFFNIDLHGMLSIDDISLCSVFANILDNGIEACNKISKPYEKKISLKARYENTYFSLEMINSKENAILKKKDRLKTDKADKKLHGLGLLSVRDIVDKYEGTLDISYTANSFTVVILIVWVKHTGILV